VRQIFLNRTQLYLHTSNCNMWRSLTVLWIW
jgi:hypothetical protein